MNKGRIWHIIILAVFAALILGVAPQFGGAQNVAGPSFEWGGDIRFQTAENLTAIRLINTPVDQGQFFQTSNRILQKMLGREKVKIQDKNIGWTGESLAWTDKNDPSSSIMQDAVNGNLSFSNQMTKFVNIANPKLPGEKNAVEMGIKFLSEMGLKPAGEEMKLLHVGGLFAQDLVDGKPTAKSQKLITLFWGREINGIQVQGPGSKIVMEIGENGAIVNFIKKWNPLMLKGEVMQPMNPAIRTIDPGKFELQPKDTGEFKIRDTQPGMFARVQLLPFLNPEEVKAAAQKALAEEWSTARSIKINNIRLVYYDRSGDFIQPAYAIEADINTSEGPVKYLHYIAALRNPPETIYPIMHFEIPKNLDAQQGIETSQEKMD